jgi:hypothetical protein
MFLAGIGIDFSGVLAKGQGGTSILARTNFLTVVVVKGRDDNLYVGRRALVVICEKESR